MDKAVSTEEIEGTAVKSREGALNTQVDVYEADDIQVLKGLEGVRVRPGMYIGDTTSRGLHHLVYEVVDNSVDEAMAGACTRIEVRLTADGGVEVRDDGRGIPVAMHPTEKIPTVQVVMTQLHAGGKFEGKGYKVSGGLHGVGVSVVNALSRRLEVEVFRDGKRYTQLYARGIPQTEVSEQPAPDEPTGTLIRFWPDETIFQVTEFQFDILAARFRELAFLNQGLRITIEQEGTTKKHDFCYEGGLREFITYLNEGKQAVHEKPFYVSRVIESERGEISVEIALEYNDSYQENLYTL